MSGVQTKKFIYAVSIVPQADYKTAPTPSTAPKNFAQVLRKNIEPAQLEVTNVDNADYTTGTPNATERFTDKMDIAPTFQDERMSAEVLGRRAFAAFGDYTVEALAGASVGAFKHTFKMFNIFTSNVLPSYALAEKAGEPALPADEVHDYLIPSLTLESLNIKSGDEAFVMGTSNFRGSGKRIKGSGVVFDGVGSHVVTESELAYNHFRSKSAKLLLYPDASFAGAAHEVDCDFREHEFTLNNELDNDGGYQGCAEYFVDGDATSGSVRGNLYVTKQTPEVGYVIRVSPDMAQIFDPQGKLETQSHFSSELSYTGGDIAGTDQKFLAVFKYKRQTVTAVGIGDNNGLAEYQITPEPLALGFDGGVELELINSIADYTAI